MEIEIVRIIICVFFFSLISYFVGYKIGVLTERDRHKGG